MRKKYSYRKKAFPEKQNLKIGRKCVGLRQGPARLVDLVPPAHWYPNSIEAVSLSFSQLLAICLGDDSAAILVPPAERLPNSFQASIFC